MRCKELSLDAWLGAAASLEKANLSCCCFCLKPGWAEPVLVFSTDVPMHRCAAQGSLWRHCQVLMLLPHVWLDEVSAIAISRQDVAGSFFP